jgi:hypothetical protein
MLREVEMDYYAEGVVIRGVDIPMDHSLFSRQRSSDENPIQGVSARGCDLPTDRDAEAGLQ